MNKNIEYSIADIEELKKKFDKNNSQILEKLKILEKEYLNIDDVLNTPNSNKIMPELYNIIKKYDSIVTNQGVYFDSVFKTTIDEYSKFVNDLSNTIEGDKE